MGGIFVEPRRGDTWWDGSSNGVAAMRLALTETDALGSTVAWLRYDHGYLCERRDAAKKRGDVNGQRCLVQRKG